VAVLAVVVLLIACLADAQAVVPALAFVNSNVRTL
jgi:hypothetical protein